MGLIGIHCVLSLTESAAVFPFSLANVRHLKETHNSVRASLVLCLGLLSFSGPREAEEGLLSQRQSTGSESPGFGSGH